MVVYFLEQGVILSFVSSLVLFVLMYGVFKFGLDDFQFFRLIYFKFNIKQMRSKEGNRFEGFFVFEIVVSVF